MRGIYIIGTDTEVGKTIVAAGLVSILIRRGCKASYFKPVSSGQIEDETGFHPADAFFVRRVSGLGEDEHIISPFAYREAVAPHLAARWEGKPVSIQKIKENLSLLKERYEIIIAEAAGGIAVPLNDHGLMQYHLIRELKFSCALVARAGLGTINHTLLTISFARQKQIEITSIFINQFTGSPLEVENVEVIRRLSEVSKIFLVPALKAPDSPLSYEIFENLIAPEEMEEILRPIAD